MVSAIMSQRLCRRQCSRRGSCIRRSIGGWKTAGVVDMILSSPWKRKGPRRIFRVFTCSKGKGRAKNSAEEVMQLPWGIPWVVPCVSRGWSVAKLRPPLEPNAKADRRQVQGVPEAGEGSDDFNSERSRFRSAADEALLRQLTAEVKHRKVGRPREKVPGYMKDRRKRWLGRVVELRRAGLSYRKIADYIHEVDGHPHHPRDHSGLACW